MLGPTHLDFIRYFYCTDSQTFLSRFRDLAGATQRTKIDKIESQVALAEEAVRGFCQKPFAYVFPTFSFPILEK